MFTFCDVLHDAKQKQKQTLESAQYGNLKWRNVLRIRTSNSSHYICPRVGYDVFYAMNCTILISKYVYFFFACRLLN